MVGALRLAVVATATVALLALLPTTAVAADSVTELLIRRLNSQLLYLAVPIALLVEVILFYAVWRFRDAEEPRPTSENRQLEITWTLATGLVLLFVGTASFAVLASPYVASVPPGHSHAGHSHGSPAQPGEAPADAAEVEVVAEQWRYTFEYPDANATAGTLVLPTNRTVYLYATSRDVLHSVHVPALALKQDAFPDQYTVIRTELTEEGTYRLFCAEYCGREHARMGATVRVVSPGEYEEWLAENGNGTPAEGGASITAAEGAADPAPAEEAVDPSPSAVGGDARP